MITTKALVSYLDNQLRPNDWRDYCPNGLQVEGATTIHHIVTAVSATQEVIEKAVACNAQAILVHHGFFWRGENPCIVGVKQKRLQLLLIHELNLLAYHLPLDVHPDWGNNVQLARLLNIKISGEFAYQNGKAIALLGELAEPVSGDTFADNIATKLQQKPFYVPGKNKEIHKIAWCSGAGQDLIEEAYFQGADAYLTGEVSERTVHLAKETGIHFFAAGHHATERYGVKALGEHLSELFHLKHQYIEIDNPI